MAKSAFRLSIQEGNMAKGPQSEAQKYVARWQSFSHWKYTHNFSSNALRRLGIQCLLLLFSSLPSLVLSLHAPLNNRNPSLLLLLDVFQVQHLPGGCHCGARLTLRSASSFQPNLSSAPQGSSIRPYSLQPDIGNTVALPL